MNDVLTPQNGVCFTIMLGSALATFYAHITTHAEVTYVCILENLGNLIGLAFSSLKTHYNRDRLMIPVSPLLL
jgi:hypothetical protein